MKSHAKRNPYHTVCDHVQMFRQRCLIAYSRISCHHRLSQFIIYNTMAFQEVRYPCINIMDSKALCMDSKAIARLAWYRIVKDCIEPSIDAC